MAWGREQQRNISVTHKGLGLVGTLIASYLIYIGSYANISQITNYIPQNNLPRSTPQLVNRDISNQTVPREFDQQTKSILEKLDGIHNLNANINYDGIPVTSLDIPDDLYNKLNTAIETDSIDKKYIQQLLDAYIMGVITLTRPEDDPMGIINYLMALQSRMNSITYLPVES